MKIQKVKISQIKPNKENPRHIKDNKFTKLVNSIKEFPKMLEIRPIVVDDEMVILGGNMRYQACKEIGLKEVFIIKANDLSEEQKKEFIIKDNVGFGEWDWDVLGNEWDSVQLEEWGMDAWLNMDDIETTDSFSLPDGDREPLQQMTFTLADEQAEYIKNAMADIKNTEEFKYMETMGNENGNGNALYLLVTNALASK